MGAKGEQTREHILAVAEALVLERGYSGTSIDEIIKEAGITKGGFFYHFDGKNDLAKHLILRYLAEDEKFFNGLAERARSLTEDPLQQLLIFLKLLAEAMADLPGMHPGCLVASFTYEAQQFDEEVHRLNAEGVLSWRRMFTEHFERVVERHPMKIHKPVAEYADLLSSVIEGGIILSRALRDKDILPNQLLQYRDYIRLVFDDV